MKELWYKNAVIYALDVKTFQDSNGDGIGDFKGLISRLPYLQNLGITCIWLLPFYPSQNRDNGYDVDDHYNVDPRLGTLDDFRDFVRKAKEAGIRVLIDLVVQHTSDRHPWFKSAVSDEKSPYRRYYLWSTRPTIQRRAHSAFMGEVKRDVWRYVPETKLWYHHWFYYFQPDLDTANPAVQEEIFKIVKFWMSFGIDGFRVDAAGLLFARYGIPGHNTKRPGGFLKKLRDVVVFYNSEAVLVGEADVRLHRLIHYIGRGNRLHMLFNFILNQYMTLAVVRKNAGPLLHILRKLPRVPEKFVWVNFARNLDEINLEKLGKDNMKEVKERLKVTDGMWIYNRGIRRRLAPMFNNDLRRLKMIWSLVFALPGNPFIPYGDEIGMGDNLRLPFRQSVRIPMQWNGWENGGFSTAPKKSLIMPVLRASAFGYPKVNVKKAEKDKDSLLLFIKKLISLRKRYTEIGKGKWRILSTRSSGVIAFEYSYGERTLITVVNLSSGEAEIDLELRAYRSVFKYIAQKRGDKIILGSYGTIWLRK